MAPVAVIERGMAEAHQGKAIAGLREQVDELDGIPAHA
jgi:hypothetical protein